MAEYEPGKMNIQEQREMYDKFWAWSKWTTIVCAAILVLMYIFLS